MSLKKNFWNNILKNLESSISQSEIDTWFSKTECNRFDDNIAIIDVPNKFIANWLRDNYLEILSSSFEKITNKRPELIFNYQNNNVNKKVNNKKNKNIKNNLNKLMNFDNFITSECNKFAYSSAVEVAENPGDFYNPFYIFSKDGIGKTHLLNSIGNKIDNYKKNINIGYINSKDFIFEFGQLSKNKSFSGFKDKYIKLDIFLFDDIQYIGNSKRLQEEFISLFDFYQGKKKQMVITGDRPPDNFNKFNSHLISRLGSGLLTEISEIDLKTKTKIIKNNIKNKKLQIPDDITNFLIKSNNNIKTILKNIIRIETYLSLNKGKLNLSLVKSIIKDRYNINIGLEDIQSIIAGYFNISISDILSKKKKSIYSYPRHLAMYMARNFTDLSFKEIGYFFGDRDHSTVIYSINRIKKSIKKNKEVSRDINNIKNLLI
ncbi:MAG: chromosomal replication initiator protein DnaA [Desulfobacteraceae bacterium]|jgi:chromosomal replication initiator protein